MCSIVGISPHFFFFFLRKGTGREAVENLTERWKVKWMGKDSGRKNKEVRKTMWDTECISAEEGEEEKGWKEVIRNIVKEAVRTVQRLISEKLASEMSLIHFFSLPRKVLCEERLRLRWESLLWSRPAVNDRLHSNSGFPKASI